jgi:hypothetical protein
VGQCGRFVAFGRPSMIADRQAVEARVEWLTVVGDPDAWRAVGLTVADDGLVPLLGTSLRIVDAASVAAAAGGQRRDTSDDGGEPAPSPGIVGWALSGTAEDASPASIDGLATEAVAVAPPVFAAHAIGASTLDHVVVATPDLERTSGAIAEATGHELKRIRDLGKIRQGFHRMGRGGLIVEIVEHADATEGPASFWGVVVIVEDLDAACAAIGPDLISPPKDAVQSGRRIATVKADAGLGVPLALMSPDVPR